jgi:orotidine-5'-phosphate decarboxylase
MSAPGVRERLIAALDVPSAGAARALADRLGDAVRFYKIGLELFSAGGYLGLLASLRNGGARVFADLKLYDIPDTVRRAVANLRESGASFLTVHAERSIMEAAAKEKGDLKILAVTVLTSFDESSIAEMGYVGSVEDLVLKRARAALESGCDGVIASGLEAPKIKAAFGDRLLVVVPGVRPVGAGAQDQKRVVDVAQAFANGVDYIVVGRPIRDAADPRAAAEAIQRPIASTLQR